MDMGTEETFAQVAGLNFEVDQVLSEIEISERSNRSGTKEDTSRVNFVGTADRTSDALKVR